MFQQRRSSQKPDKGLLAHFKQQFPEISTVGGSASSGAGPQPALAVDNSGLGPLVPAPDGHHNVSQDAFRDQDPTPRASAAEWGFTPFVESGAYGFGGQPQGYYTPTPGGNNTVFHSQAGDPPTPSVALAAGLGTPLSLPTTDGAMLVGHVGHVGHVGPYSGGMVDMSHFQGALAPQHFHQPYGAFLPQSAHQSAFPPSTFVQSDTGYESMDHSGSPLSGEDRSEQLSAMDATFSSQSPPMGFQQGRFGGIPMSHAPPDTGNQFRFSCILNAPTAMTRLPDEIPVTYLNKGQVYTLSVTDTALRHPAPPGSKYRTFVRISFEDKQQRQKPDVCWGLWKEGRGTNEAHQRGGRLQAVEYVEPSLPVDADNKRTRMELQSSSFDGFCVVWSPGHNGPAECNITVRFNFLSTDFSHSKGVKGIPVRLCAKTTIVSTANSSPVSDPASEEICYCMVKLFRDHGAERKLSNDTAHVTKSIQKLQHQITQSMHGVRDAGKRKRGASDKLDTQRPGKAKHKRTWSMSSASSADGGGGAIIRPAPEDDLQLKLQSWEAMLHSTRPVSLLYLRGDEMDDPDLHPVSLGGESANLSMVDPHSARSSIAESSLISPSASSLSIHSQAAGESASLGRVGGADPLRPPGHPVKVAKIDDDGNVIGWFESIEVDPLYKPPSERPVKPIACFYVARKKPNADGRVLHRAVYLTERSLSNFISRVATKWNIDPADIRRVVRVLGGGLEVAMDDDVIRELSEGQDMTLEIAELDVAPSQLKREWEPMAIDVPDDDEGFGSGTYPAKAGYELRFTF
ncbi:CP2 transcription factor-domain-containing protein [Poronia punctata]|nr:CP2 transcription factor-domain-containing protein [Poronia punctata]